MRRGDVVGLALGALARQKMRTGLTLLGVTVGALVITVSLAAGQGLEGAIVRLVETNRYLRRVEVHSGTVNKETDIPAEVLALPGAMSEARRARLRRLVVQHWIPREARPEVPLTAARAEALAALPGVADAVPGRPQPCLVTWSDKAERTQGLAVAAAEPKPPPRVVAGTWFGGDTDRGVVLHEYLAYRLGLTDEADLPRILGQTVRLTFARGRAAGKVDLAHSLRWAAGLSAEEAAALEKALDRLPGALAAVPWPADERAALERVLRLRKGQGLAAADVVLTADLPVIGVLRGLTEEEAKKANWDERKLDDAGVILPARTALDLWLRLPEVRRDGLASLALTAEHLADVRAVAAAVKAHGLEEYALADYADQARGQVQLVTWVMAGLAGVVLLVSALGITNVLVMSVLERTHEIGVMKAVGATDAAVLGLFLVEGGLLGAAGGVLGVLLGWLATLAGEALLREQLKVFQEFEGDLFAFPWWLVLGVPVLTTAVTTLAAVYPARRAARLNPVIALRHE